MDVRNKCMYDGASRPVQLPCDMAKFAVLGCNSRRRDGLHLTAGASGFGTPVALAAPMLSSLGHDPLLTVVCLLIMNTFATQFGERAGCMGQWGLPSLGCCGW